MVMIDPNSANDRIRFMATVTGFIEVGSQETPETAARTLAAHLSNQRMPSRAEIDNVLDFRVIGPSGRIIHG